MEYVLGEPARWVDQAEIDLGEGARGGVSRGLMFPLLVDGAPGGFVFVGAAEAGLVVGRGAPVLAYMVPELRTADGRVTLGGDLVVAFGRDPDLVAAAALGQPIVDDPDHVGYLDADGREVVVITDLRPRRARNEAEAALRQRTWMLEAAGVSPTAMFAREALRDGAPRSVVELRPSVDLGPLAAAVDPEADGGKTWATWVVDPSGLVDDELSGVFAVHGPKADTRVFRSLGGTAHTTRPAHRVTRGVANATLARSRGSSLEVEITARLTIEPGAKDRVIDLWVPDAPDARFAGGVSTKSSPDPAVSAGGVAAAPLDAPFGRRRVADAVLRTVVLPEVPAPGVALTIDVAWTEEWDVGGVVFPADFVSWAWTGPNDQRPGVAVEIESVGKVMSGRSAFPVLATGPRTYPAELRAGTNVPNWVVRPPPGGTSTTQENGVMHVVSGTSPMAFSIGRYREVTSPARGKLPPIRVAIHTPTNTDLLVAARGILNFYDDALPRWPWPELVVVQGANRPVLLHPSSQYVRTEASLWTVLPGFVDRGGGEIELQGVFPIGDAQLLDVAPLRKKADRDGAKGRSMSGTRSLAEALASSWWSGLDFAERDRWLQRAIPKVYRDRFVEEAWGRAGRDGWQAYTETSLAFTEPAGDVLPLEGADAEWAAERGARLLGYVHARLGEETTLSTLDAWRSAPRHDADSLVAALDDASGRSFGPLFDAFVKVGLRPKVTLTRTDDGAVRIRTEPPLDGIDLPVQVGNRIDFVPLIDGEATLDGIGAREVAVDPRGWLPLR